MRKIRGNPLRRRRIDNPSGRQRSKSKESVKRPIRAHRCNPCFLIKAPRMVSVSICGICGRNNLVPHSTSHISHPSFRIPHPSSHTQHSTFNIPHPTFHIPHFTSHTPHSTLHTPHSQHPSPPAKYLCLSSAPAVQSVLLTSTPHGFCVDLWHLREKYSCAAWHIPHSAAPMRRTYSHSQHSSPKSTRFFPSRPAPRPNTPFSAHHCNRLTTSPLPSEDPAPHSKHTFPHHETPSFDPPSLPFRGPIPYLSHLDP